MSKHRIRHKVLGIGKECNQCGVVMERRTHLDKPKKTWYYTEWDICNNQSCNKTVQHYEEFKSSQWKESEEQQNHLLSI